ncbi:MAG: hypothetical protein MZV64_42190 [Ignavibacteriales bacterium]|nr:hypothetical protein [Ignavibacteriales bacterium]
MTALLLVRVVRDDVRACGSAAALLASAFFALAPLRDSGAAHERPRRVGGALPVCPARSGRCASGRSGRGSCWASASCTASSRRTGSWGRWPSRPSTGRCSPVLGLSGCRRPRSAVAVCVVVGAALAFERGRAGTTALDVAGAANNIQGLLDRVCGEPRMLVAGFGALLGSYLVLPLGSPSPLSVLP